MRNLFFAMAMLCAFITTAQTVQPMGLINSGKHFKVVFAAEGFQSSELATFDAVADELKASLMAQAPFSSNLSKINFYKFRSASVDSGISTTTSPKNTYFDAMLTSGGGGIDLSPTGSALVETKFGQLSGGNQVYVVIIANTTDYVGVGSFDDWDEDANAPGGTNKSQHMIVGLYSQYNGREFIFRHEFGHTFSQLADEYVDQATYDFFMNLGNPNLANRTPLEPNISATQGGVFQYQGARYHPTNYWRSSENGLMRGDWEYIGGTWVAPVEYGAYNQTLVQAEINLQAKTIIGQQFNISVSGSTTSACNFTSNQTRWHDGSSYMPAVNDYVYTDVHGVNKFNGGNKWYKVMILSKEVRINSAGRVTEVRDCSGGGGGLQ